MSSHSIRFVVDWQTAMKIKMLAFDLGIGPAQTIKRAVDALADGSHSNGLEVYDTLKDAIAEATRLNDCLEDKTAIVIEGNIVEV